MDFPQFKSGIVWALIFILFLPPYIASASDFSPLLVDAYFVIIAVPYAVINAIVTCVLLGKKKYRSKKLLVSHAIITMIVLAVGVIIHAGVGMMNDDDATGMLVIYFLYTVVFIGMPAVQYWKNA